jgi:biotin carboxyl carrier protein
MSKLAVQVNGQTFEIEVDLRHAGESELTVLVDGEPVQVQLPGAAGQNGEIDWVVVDDRPYEVTIDPQLRWVKAYGGIHEVKVRDKDATVTRPRSADGRVKAPIPGLVTQVLVKVGDEVKTGEPLFILEAMKMENPIRAPREGKVTAVHAEAGRPAAQNEVLAEIE